MEEYLVVRESATAEIIEKKSRFIAHVIPVSSEEEALSIIDKIKKKYWDARHNCFAFVTGRNNEIQRFSDDGEPQGTAGKPILEVLLNANLRNTLIVVTRYFGGTLLGTGGLVRAYGQSSKAAIENAILLRVCEGVRITISTDYNSIGKIKYIIGQMGIKLVDEQYSDKVFLTLDIKEAAAGELKTKITDVTSGQAVFEREEPIEYMAQVT